LFGGVVRLNDNTAQLVDSVAFGSELPWPTEPNGMGPKLELRQFKIDNTNADSWKSSLVILGTPGSKNSITTGSDGFANSCSEK